MGMRLVCPVEQSTRVLIKRYRASRQRIMHDRTIHGFRSHPLEGTEIIRRLPS